MSDDKQPKVKVEQTPNGIVVSGNGDDVLDVIAALKEHFLTIKTSVIKKEEEE